MTEHDADKIFEEFLAVAPNSASIGDIPTPQANVLESIVTNNAPILAREWGLPQPRSDLKKRMVDDTVESSEIDQAFAVTWALTVAGFLLAEYFWKRKIDPMAVDLDQLKQTCEQNYHCEMDSLLTADLKQLANKCTQYLAEVYSRQEHLSEMLKLGRVKMQNIQDLAERAVLAGIFVWQMADNVRHRAN